MQRKAKQDTDSKGDKDSSKDKDEKHKSESSSSEPSGNYFEGQSDDPFTPSGSQPLNPNMPYSPEGMQNFHFCYSCNFLTKLSLPISSTAESFCSSDISLDDSNGPLDDSGTELHNLESHSHPSSHHHHGLSSGGGGSGSEILPSYNQINPIDKLYLMQNSYFTDPWSQLYLSLSMSL